MIGQPLCTMPVAAYVAPAAAVDAGDFRLIDILCRFAAATIQAACYTPVRHIAAGRILSFDINTVFDQLVPRDALCRGVSVLSAIFQPEEA